MNLLRFTQLVVHADLWNKDVVGIPLNHAAHILGLLHLT